MVEGWGFGGAETFTNEVKVAEGNDGQRLGWAAELGGEATANGVKEGRVGRGTKGAGDIGGLELSGGGTVGNG